MVHVDRPVPDGIPGERVVDEEQLYHLRSHLASICGLNSTRSVHPSFSRAPELIGCWMDRFPGSQPVSFDLESLTLLEEEECVQSLLPPLSLPDARVPHSSFWVCEKSDGVRVLVLILATETGQEVYLVCPHHCISSTTDGRDVDRQKGRVV